MNIIASSLNKSRKILSGEFQSFYPKPIVINKLGLLESQCGVKFNILPGRNVEETIKAKKYILSKRKIEAVFDRKYLNDMIDSPDHLIFLTSLVHLQKMIYMYLCYEFGLSLSLHKKEQLKVWPTKINIELPKIITKSKDISQIIEISSLRKTSDKSYFGKCRSSIDGIPTITADAVIYKI